jgi:hypothetical protein
MKDRFMKEAVQEITTRYFEELDALEGATIVLMLAQIIDLFGMLPNNKTRLTALNMIREFIEIWQGLNKGENKT